MKPFSDFNPLVQILIVTMFLGADNVWSYFVTVHKEDQILLLQELRRIGCKSPVTFFGGNPEAPITHPSGEASQYARYVSWVPSEQ